MAKHGRRPKAESEARRDRCVRAQYESHPYPERAPADEARRLIVGSPSHIHELNHYVFGGKRDFTRPFRVLFAGGGTGDGTIMLAQQLASRNAPADLVYLDPSNSARAVAEARAKARGLTNLRFETGSLLDLPQRLEQLGGAFDYIDCCGVLHHLERPEAGLAALAAVLAPTGGIGLMVYAELGRTGVYHIQDMLKMLCADEPDRVRIATARALTEDLPPGNWLRRNPAIGDHRHEGDAGIYDLLLHSRDRAYYVPELLDLVEGAGLKVAAFIEPVRYDPRTHLTDKDLIRRANRLDWRRRCAFAELLAGTIKKHTIYAVPADRVRDCAATYDDPKAVPVLAGEPGAALAAQLRPGGAIAVEIDGSRASAKITATGLEIVRRIDGWTTLRDIHADIADAEGGKLDWRGFLREWRPLYEKLNGFNRLWLSGAGS